MSLGATDLAQALVDLRDQYDAEAVAARIRLTTGELITLAVDRDGNIALEHDAGHGDELRRFTTRRRRMAS